MWYRIKTIALVAIMITVGALFPKTVLTYQDKILQGKVSKYNINQIEFKTENEIFNILNNISNNNFYYSREIVSGMEKAELKYMNRKNHFENYKEYCSSDLDFENIKYHNESADLYIEDSQNSIYVNDNLNYGISGTSNATASDENKKIVRCRKKL